MLDYSNFTPPNIKQGLVSFICCVQCQSKTSLLISYPFVNSLCVLIHINIMLSVILGMHIANSLLTFWMPTLQKPSVICI